ncbi:MAG TPA: hypothetical protein VHX62_02260 [Solirubrobacteraceae bacterium]|nr:hypothetical protein [Solirubrobacteraceae bacterium]
MHRALVVVGALALALMAIVLPAGTAQAAKGHSPTLAPNDTVIDGPDTGVVSLDGMSIARDGTGGVAYLKDVAGVAHVFVSRLINGSFQAPVQVDPGLLGPSSPPVIAAGQEGALEVAFINGGQLYVTETLSTASGFTAPADIFAGAANPSISMSNFGKAYLAFTDTNGAGGGDVRAAYYYAGQWALESTPLDANPADAAGTGTGRPQVTCAGDGIAIVIWGEAGHIYTRRVVKTTPSVVYEQADPSSLDGWSEVSSSDPVIAAGGDDTYASVAFQETFSNGSTRESRVLMNRLHASQYDGITEGDGATMGGPEGADQPATAVTEYGEGFVTSEHDSSHQLWASTLGSNDGYATTLRVDSLPNGDPPDAVPATAGLVSTFIAWQQNPGVAGPAEIRVRYAPDGVDLGPEEVVSNPALGPADADLGLAAGGDVSGDGAVAWVQGSGASASIVAAQLYQAPGGFVFNHSFQYANTAAPLLGWSPAAELWGSPQYGVRVDGAQVAVTTGQSTQVPLSNGRHVVSVSAVNQAGLTSVAPNAVVFVDTVPPRVSFKLSGALTVKTRVALRATYSDPPPRGLPESDASGVKTVVVKWGDGTQTQLRRTTTGHDYSRARAYTVTVIATDRAGNTTVVRKKIKIVAHAKTKRRRHSKKRGRAAAGNARVAQMILEPGRSARGGS